MNDLAVSAAPIEHDARIQRVLSAACSADRPHASLVPPTGSNPAARSWVRLLHDAFRCDYDNHPEVGLGTIKVFSAGCPIEIGFDVLVAGTDACTPSSVHQELIPVFRQPLWQVKSELNPSGREVAADLGKLVMGAAPNKLFVTCFRNDVSAFNDFLVRISCHCTGNLYVAYVPSYSRTRDALLWEQSGYPIPYGLYRRVDKTMKQIASSKDWSHHKGNHRAWKRWKSANPVPSSATP